MKIGIHKMFLAVAVFALLPLAGNLSAATLAVSPAATSNTYTGNITLNIGGLANGETVVVQKWLDNNANDAVDPGEVLMDTFSITDGGAMIINGITNISVPFDRNPVTGAITTTLNFSPPLTVENIVGHHLYRVVSPGGNFAPVTATLIVTNAATAQTLSGIVYSNGVALPYALVVGLPQNGYAGAAVADASGHYSLNLNPGTYNVIATAPNCYFDESSAPTVELTNGVLATNDLNLTGGTVTVAGSVYDSANSNGIAGLMIQLQSGSQLELAFTDTNGNFSAAVTADFWKIKLTKERLSRRAYVAPQKALQVDASAGNVSNANVAVFKGTALFYGRITDNSGTPLVNIRIDSGDGTNNLYASVGYSDTNGYYAVAALGNVSSDWNCSANDSDNPILDTFIVNSPNDTNITVGQTILQNFLVLPVTAHIHGQVTDDFGNPIVGVDLYAGSFIGGNSYVSQSANTDDNGNYSLGVASGTWGVNFSEGGNSGLDTAGYVDFYQPHLVDVPPLDILLNLTVVQTGTPFISDPVRLSATQFRFNIQGAADNSYEVQATTNLLDSNGWFPLFDLTLTNTVVPITDPHATNSVRYYRIQQNQGGT